MNIGETNSIPNAAPPAPPREPVEPAHKKQETEQVESETREAVSAADKGPNVGRFVDITA